MRFPTLLVISILLSACVDPCVDQIISKAADSEKKTDFILVRRNCGATTGYIPQIYIVASGASHLHEQPIFSADKVENLKAIWLDGSKLEIGYDSARIFSFTNFWQSSEVDNFKLRC